MVKRTVRLDVIEAVFRHQLASESKARRHRFLSIDDEGDPPSDMLARLRALDPDVHPASVAVSAKDAIGHVKHRTLGGRGMLLSVGAVNWIDRCSADVELRYYVHGLNAGSGTCRVTCAHGTWVVGDVLFTTIS